MWQRTYEGKKVVMKEITDDVGTVRVVLAWPKGTRLNQRAQAFVTFGQNRHRDRGSSTSGGRRSPKPR